MEELRQWVQRVIETGGMLSMEELNEGYRLKLMLDDIVGKQTEKTLSGDRPCCLLLERSATETISERN